MNQLFGMQHAPRLSNCNRRGAHMLGEQSSQLPLADSEPLREQRDTTVIQHTVVYHL